MGFQWHLATYLAKRDLTWQALEERVGFSIGRDLRAVTPPVDLSLSVLADLCQALGCQPGDLLTFSPDSPAEQAERQLAANPLFQSFLAYKESKDERKPKR